MNKSWWQQFEGRTIESKYVLQRLLGVGGFGGVFEADHVVEGTFVRHVALKLIVSDEEQSQSQLGELVASSTLHHASLLGCFDVGATAFESLKLLYLVMELAEEGLHTRLSNGGVMPVPETMELTKSLAKGLAYLHEQKRVHRDVKPSNVLSVEGTWKLADFGAIRSSSGTTTLTGMMFGTVEYMPPEGFDGVVSPAWDTWSLGVLILRALTGRSPYPGTAREQLMGAILHKEPEIPADLPVPFGDIVRGCLVKDCRERCDAQRIVAMIERTEAPSPGLLDGDEVTQATPIPVVSHAPLPPRQRRWKWIAASFAVIILATIAVLALFLHSNGSVHAVSAPSSKAHSKLASDAPENKRFDYTFSPAEQPCGAAPRVTVLNLNGKVQITGGAVPATKVTVRRSVHAPDKEGADQANSAAPVELNCQNNDLNVITNREPAPEHSGLSTDLDIVVPKGASIVARDGQGDVAIARVEGSVFVNRDKGSVRLQSIGGDVRVKLGDSALIRAAAVDGTAELIVGSEMTFKAEKISGEINYQSRQLTGQNIVGPIHLNARSASIQLNGFTEELEAKLSGTGDIALRPSGATPPPMTVALESGNIDLTLPSGLRFDLNLATASGRAENEYGPELTVDGEGQGAAIKGGDDGPKLRLSTRRGQVTVRKNVVQTKPFVPPPPAP